MATDPTIIARYFTPKVQWSVEKTEIRSGNEFTGELRMNCGPYVSGVDLRSAMLYRTLPTNQYVTECTLFEIKGVAIEWFEIQYKSDARFYAINSAGDIRRLRSASFLGSPSSTNIGGMQFPDKVFSFAGAHFDSKVFQTYMFFGGAINMDITYRVPNFADFGLDIGDEVITFTTNE